MPALDPEFDRRYGISAAWQRGARGAGVTVAVIDTALDPTHPDLAGRVDGTLDFTGQAPVASSESHGTSIATLIRLVAPECRILGLTVFPTHDPFFGFGWNARVRAAATRAVRHCTERATALRVCNMSFAIPRGRLLRCRPGARCRLCRAVNEARAAGVLPIAAAGNTGPGDDTIECPGGAEGAETVAAVLTAADRAAYERDPSDRERFGTSFAAAYVAGGAALLLSACPEATPDEIKAAFDSSARPLPGVPRNRQGAGRVHYAAALDVLIGPSDEAFDDAWSRVYFVDGNRDAQRPDNAYVTGAIETVLLYIERSLLRRGEVAEAVTRLDRLRGMLLPDRLGEYVARVDALRARIAG